MGAHLLALISACPREASASGACTTAAPLDLLPFAPAAQGTEGDSASVAGRSGLPMSTVALLWRSGDVPAAAAGIGTAPKPVACKRWADCPSASCWRKSAETEGDLMSLSEAPNTAEAPRAVERRCCAWLAWAWIEHAWRFETQRHPRCCESWDC
jgi:hypothetical protein